MLSRNTAILYFLPLLVILASSCATTVNISKLKSESVQQRKDESFAYEDDTIKILYNFWENSESLRFRIYNKSENPIYINWKKSSFIYHGKSYNYWDDDKIVEGESVTDEYLGDLYTVSLSRVKSERPTKQIPPQSYTTVDEFIFNYTKPSAKVKNRNEIETLKFEKRDSPIKFRNYIAYSTDEDFSHLNYVDNEFWLKEVDILSIKKYKNDYKIPFEKNRFYLVLNNHYTKSGRIVGTSIGAVAGGALLTLITIDLITAD